LNEIAVQDPQEATAAYDPRPSREGARSRPHPLEERFPWLLFHGKDDEDVAYVYTFVGRTVIFRLQIRSKPHEQRSRDQRLWPDAVLDVEGI
jgi:hypothetical protein